MTIPVSTILTRVQTTLLDPAPGVYWTSAEIIDYINSAVKAVCMVKPDAYILAASFSLTTNQSRYSIPSDGFQLIDIPRALAPKIRGIIQVDRSALDEDDPTWPSVTGTVTQNFMVDPRDPKTFYVYPAPSTSGQIVELVYAAIPVSVSSSSDAVPLDAVYENPIVYWVLSEAYAKNSKRGDITKSATYMNSFMAMMGQKSKVQVPYTSVTGGKN